MRSAAGSGAPDEGRVLLLALGCALVAGVLVLVTAAAAGVHLQRKRVVALADAAAADAADAVDEAAYYAPGGGADPAGVPLSDASVRASAEAHLRRAAAVADLGEVVVAAGTGSPDGRTAVVVLRARLVPPWAAAGPVRLGAVDVRVESRAVARLR